MEDQEQQRHLPIFYDLTQKQEVEVVTPELMPQNSRQPVLISPTKGHRRIKSQNQPSQQIYLFQNRFQREQELEMTQSISDGHLKSNGGVENLTIRPMVNRSNTSSFAFASQSGNQ